MEPGQSLGTLDINVFVTPSLTTWITHHGNQGS